MRKKFIPFLPAVSFLLVPILLCTLFSSQNSFSVKSASAQTINYLNVPSEYPTIQSAIDGAQSGDVVEVSAGIYNEVINFNGKAITVRGAGSEQTVFDGTGLNDSVVTVNSGESSQNTVLESVTVRNGTGKIIPYGGDNNASWGGGLFVDSSSITVRNVVFENNTAYYGAAIEFYQFADSSILDNIYVKNNTGKYTVIETWDSVGITIKNSTISDNLIGLGTSGGLGGILVSVHSSMLYENVIVENNHNDSTYSVMSIWANTGIFGPDVGPVVLRNTVMRNNKASRILVTHGGNLVIERSELSKNISFSGLMTFHDASFLKILNSTIADNQATNNHPETDDRSVINNYNFLEPYPGFDTNGDVIINNTVIWGNIGPNNNEPITPLNPNPSSQGSAPIFINYSIIQGGWPNENRVGVLDTDPLFADSLNGNFQLTENSPAIDAGDPINLLDPDGTRADMGAYPFFQTQSPMEAVEGLVVIVESLNLQQGIENSLDAKLNAALQALDDVNENNDEAAINSLQSFINAVEAQRGNKITNEQADILVNKAQEVINSLTQ